MNKDPELGDNYVDEGEEQDVEGSILKLAEQEGIPIDPALGSGWAAVNITNNTDSHDEDDINENPEEVAQRAGIVLDLDESQFVLPDGGIVQDPQHAYEYTDAITFTYPDPAMGQLPPSPIEGYQEAAAELLYQEDEPPSPSNIEMVERKRKRKTEEGDKAFHYKPQLKKKSSKKQRRSLVVRLTISKDKMKEIDKMASIVQTAINGVVAPAPVVSSDLQALNVYPDEDGQPPAKKVRREERLPPTEVDTEYAPGRPRDRRKVPIEGTKVPPTDANIERRTTRLQNVTYAEPDEEEFNEIVVPKSKLATMESANVLDSVENDTNHAEDTIDDEDEEGPDMPQSTGKRPVLTTPAAVVNFANSARSSPQVLAIQKSLPAISSPNTSRPSTAYSAAQKIRLASKTAIEVQAQANRRAKMAAIDSDIDDIEDIDGTSEGESDDTPELPDVPLPKPVARATVNSTIPKSSLGQPTMKGTSTTVAAKKKSTNGSSIGKSQPTNPRSGQKIMPTTTAIKAASAQKASANDWTDSDSD